MKRYKICWNREVNSCGHAGKTNRTWGELELISFVKTKGGAKIPSIKKSSARGSGRTFVGGGGRYPR